MRTHVLLAHGPGFRSLGREAGGDLLAGGAVLEHVPGGFELDGVFVGVPFVYSYDPGGRGVWWVIEVDEAAFAALRLRGFELRADGE